MQFRISLYVEAQQNGFQVRPLFLDGPREKAAHLERALARQAVRLRQEMSRRAGLRDHAWFRRLCYNPPLKERMLNLEFDHKKRTGRCRRLVAVLKQQQRLLFFPGLDPRFFPWPPGMDLKERSTELLKLLLKELKLEPEQVHLEGRAWVGELELEHELDHSAVAINDDRALLGGPRLGQAADELEKVGRSLDDLYPGELLTHLGREPELARLTSWLESPARGAMVVVGGSRVGKTSLIHELVRRQRNKMGSDPRRRFWQLSASRLISGMSYQGQWERRFLSLLEHAQENDLVLYFDDLLALSQAGKSRHCELCLADLLKPVLERQGVRVVSETTVEGFSLAQERDPGLAALLTPVRLSPTSTRQTLDILAATVQHLELKRELRLAPAVLPDLLTLCSRHRPSEEFPGKAVDFLNRLSCFDEEIERRHLTLQVAADTGMSMDILDDSRPVDVRALRRRLGAEIVSQPEAVEILLETICLAKSRLCDPGRPLATLLFAGPTGVGKTFCARLLAKHLFGGDEALLRFDMNEFLDPWAAQRLSGTPAQPQGLLTQAIKRRPHCVLLLDEIEKAHPDVFHLLLQVMGDARLTDASGQTADFSQAVVVLTSNLGAEQSGQRLGFRQNDDGEAQNYQSAVRAFFTPEFVNRIDHLISFERLDAEAIHRLTEMQLEALLNREGLKRRRLLLNSHPEAVRRLAAAGFHPQLGARALKRTLERQVTVPLARQLAGRSDNPPSILQLLPAGGDGGVEVRLLPLEPAEAQLSQRRILDTEGFCGALDQALNRAEQALEKGAPEGTMDSDLLTSDQYLYFAATDQLRRARGAFRRLTRPGKPRNRSRYWLDPAVAAKAVTREPSGWETLFSSATFSSAEETAAEAVSQFAFLDLLIRAAQPRGQSNATAILNLVDGSPELRLLLEAQLRELAGFLELACQPEKSGSLQLQGPLLNTLVEACCGLHLFLDQEGKLTPVWVEVAGRPRNNRLLYIYDTGQGRCLCLRSGWLFNEPLPLTENALTDLLLRSLPVSLDNEYITA